MVSNKKVSPQKTNHDADGDDGCGVVTDRGDGCGVVTDRGDCCGVVTDGGDDGCGVVTDWVMMVVV